ncbi:MAG: hypothetical protein ABIQ17_01685 [Candidatus Limnocylindrales bacterium]
MRQPRKRATLILAIGLLVTACGGGATVAPATSAPDGACAAAPQPPSQQEGWTAPAEAPSAFPTIVNSSLTCGENRLLFTFVDATNRAVAKPDRTATVALFNLGRDTEKSTLTAEATFVWGIEDVRGFYIANVQFPEAGRWGAEFTTAVGAAEPEKIRMTFDVNTSSPTIRVGDKAPASDTLTTESVGGDLARVSTDKDPDPAFYGTSVKAALAARQPFVLIFATPKFCQSAQCGPTLDRIKPLATDYPTVTFIAVEPYELVFRDESLTPALDANGDLQSVPAVSEWGLLSEPWVFVVDRDGIVTASFEGILSVDEIRAAADAVK